MWNIFTFISSNFGLLVLRRGRCRRRRPPNMNRGGTTAGSTRSHADNSQSFNLYSFSRHGTTTVLDADPAVRTGAGQRVFLHRSPSIYVCVCLCLIDDVKRRLNWSSNCKLCFSFVGGGLIRSMGNYVSCALAGGPGGGSRSAKVILPGGEVRRVDWPATAAEMMLDAPGHFVVSSRSMHAGRRFAPLAADEELEMGHVYVMFPMKRAAAVVTAADMAALLLAAQREVRREAGGARVLPDRPMVVGPETENTAAAELGEGMEGAAAAAAAAAEIGELKYRLSFCRSRKPNLETIHEEGICFSR